MDDLGGKVAVITGAGSGIGAALSRAFAREGCAVVLADVEMAALERTSSTIDGDVLTVRTDVSDPAAVDALADAAFARHGAVHIVCNNAGVSTFNPVLHQTLDDWRWVLGVNLWGVVHGVASFLPRLVAQGEPAHIVNTSSLAGLQSGLPMLGPYSVAKVGVVALSECLRLELAMSGSPVAVSVLCPGSTVTEILESERNRPEGLRQERRTADGEGMRQAVYAGFGGPMARTPDAVAAEVVDAVRTNRFWVITSAEMRDGISARFDEIMTAMPTHLS